MSIIRSAQLDPGALGGEPTPSSVRGSAGRYQLCCELATGGMATVFLARVDGPGGFDKMVALKRIHPHLAREPEFVEMFLDEARIASRIQHPNVCAVFDFGDSGGSYYIAMEYLLGESLQDVLREIGRRVPAKRPARWVEIASLLVGEAAEGLHAAHELRDHKGELLHVVHRDVSPPNLFVGYDGIVKVVDFGIARARGRIHATNAGTIKGKYTYMAPEQAARGELDRRADVWSLGVVLWELLTCRRLFRREREAETIMAVCSLAIPKPSTLNRAVPAELDLIVMRALSRNLDTRYPTAREMSRDIRRFLRRSPEPMGTVELAEWMAEEFKEQRTQRLKLVEESRTSAIVVRREEQSGKSDEDSLSLRASLPELEIPIDVMIANSEHPPPPKRRRAWLVAPIALAAVACAVLGFWFATGGTLLGTTTPSGAQPTPTPVAAGEVPEPAGPPPIEGTPPAAEPAPDPVAVVPVEPAAATPTAPLPTEPAVAATAPLPTDPAVAATTPLPTEPVDVAPPTTGPSPATKIRRPPRPTVPRPVAPPAAPGALAIATPGGWADVYLGARWLGRTPGRVTLPAGNHVLSLRPFGQLPAKRASVTIPAGGSTRISVPLE